MNNLNHINANRRHLLKSTLVGASAAALSACSSSVPSSHQTSTKVNNFMLSEQELHERKHEIKQRMRYRMDSGDMAWSLDGVVYAQQGGMMVPLFNILHCGFYRIEPRQAGGFDMLSYELGFRTDLETGERLTEFTNPFNGDVIAIPFAPVGPIEVQYTPEIELILPDDIGGSKMEFEEQPDIYRQDNNNIYIEQVTRGKVITKGKRDRYINEFTNLYGDTKTLTDTSQNFVATRGFHSDVSDYARWMKMSPEFGSQTLRAMSTKTETRENINKKWMDIVKTVDSEIYKNPFSVLDREKAKYLG